MRAEGPREVGVGEDDVQLPVPDHRGGVGAARSGVEAEGRFPVVAGAVEADHHVGDLWVAVAAAAGGAGEHAVGQEVEPWLHALPADRRGRAPGVAAVGRARLPHGGVRAGAVHAENVAVGGDDQVGLGEPLVHGQVAHAVDQVQLFGSERGDEVPRPAAVARPDDEGRHGDGPAVPAVVSDLVGLPRRSDLGFHGGEQAAVVEVQDLGVGLVGGGFPGQPGDLELVPVDGVAVRAPGAQAKGRVVLLHHQVKRSDVFVPRAPVGLDRVVLEPHDRAVAEIPHAAAAEVHAGRRVAPGLTVVGREGVAFGLHVGDGVLRAAEAHEEAVVGELDDAGEVEDDLGVFLPGVDALDAEGGGALAVAVGGGLEHRN